MIIVHHWFFLLNIPKLRHPSLPVPFKPLFRPGLDPDSIGSVDLDPGKQKWPQKKREKNEETSYFGVVDVLCGGLE
jgi:hypothetical protein